MSRVLVTGASGFIGRRALPALLEAGYEVHAIAREPSPGPQTPEIVWHGVDLLEPGAGAALVRRVLPRELLHLAWYAKHGAFWTAPENASWAAATLDLLRAFGDTGGRRAVLAGSCAEYDWAALAADGVCHEHLTPLAPQTFYGVSKHATRLVAEGCAAATGFELAWGRLFFLYGPAEQPGRLVPSVARALLSGREAPTTSGEQVRDFMYVDDASRAFVGLLESDVQGAVNIASGRGVEVRELVALLAEEVGRPELLRVGALETRAAEPAAIVADTRRLREEVGFASNVGLEQGLAEAVDWWRAQ
jgi:nucleoside-diphosphate-sugar epimerase